MADHRLPLRASSACRSRWRSTPPSRGGARADSEFLKESEGRDSSSRCSPRSSRRTPARAVVIAGRRQPPEVHAIVAQINQTLGAVGATLDYLEDPDAGSPDAPRSRSPRSRKDMAAGTVQTLIILGGNPVYDAPADLDFAGALAKVGDVDPPLASTQTRPRRRRTWHVPQAHFLEAWGDARTWDGTQSARAAADRAAVRRPVDGRAAVDAARRREDGEELVAGDARAARPRQLEAARARRLRAEHRACRPRRSRSRRRAAGQPDAEPAAPAASAQGERARGRLPLLERSRTTVASRTTRGCWRPRTSSRRSPGTTTRWSRRRPRRSSGSRTTR